VGLYGVFPELDGDVYCDQGRIDSCLWQSDVATQAGLTAALMGVLELMTPRHHILLWRSDSTVLGSHQQQN
jgi:hypothetical protein